MCAMCRPRLRPKVDGPAKYTSPVLFLFIADSKYRTPIEGSILPDKSARDRSTAGDLCDLAQKPGNGASRTLHKPDCGQCEKRKWSRGGYEGRALSRWDGGPGSAHCQTGALPGDKNRLACN